MTTTIQSPAYTPGPWTIEGSMADRSTAYFHILSGDKKWRVATAFKDNEEGIGNAHLIASAPDMLAALQFSLTCPDEDEARRVVEEAIAKATL